MKKEHEEFARELMWISTTKIFAPTNRYVNTAVMMDLPALYDFVIKKWASKFADNSIAEEQYDRILNLLYPHMEDVPESIEKWLKDILNVKKI